MEGLVEFGVGFEALGGLGEFAGSESGLGLVGGGGGGGTNFVSVFFNSRP